MSEYFCNNCGNNGHLFYQCKRPITSIGVISFRININTNNIEYLMVKRKDSLGFVELLRGKYNIYNIFHLQNLFNELTNSEKDILKKLSFNDLWSYLWGFKNNNTNDFIVAQEKFNLLKKGIIINNKLYNLENYLNNIQTNWNDSEWGFPKGRRNFKENDLECAKREYQEETGYLSSYINFIENLYTNEEIFTGSNLKSYKHKYYIGKMDYDKTLNDSNFQKSEIGDMKWLTINECLNLIRPYNYEKKNELNKINTLLNTYRLSV